MSEKQLDNPSQADKTGKASSAMDTPWASEDHEPATVIVLAGGKSRRMGSDKSLLLFMGKPLIQHICVQVAPHFDELLIAGGKERQLHFLNARIVPDEISGQGPLRGIASALADSHHDLNFVIACDIPWVNFTLLRNLLREANNCDWVIPITAEGHYEPLFAVYRKSALPGMRQALEEGERRVVGALRHCRVKTVCIPSSDGIKNINTKDDYRKLLAGRD
ncbi:MAG TPA: molybdenum cofactor guanylyltransferase [Candidatus Hydrogenedentes bacterium]|nr:molybdenum cofactor guanylyltransferase [Candidatus Hydrogenedentota bacterium]